MKRYGFITIQRMGSIGFFSLKPCATKLKMKCMVITFFDGKWESLVDAQPVPDGQTVNVDWYVKVLKRLVIGYILFKRPYYHNGQWKLHHDNAHPQVAQHVQNFLASHGVEVILQARYSPDLISRGFFFFFFFLMGKRDLTGRHFESPQATLRAAENTFKCLVSILTHIWWIAKALGEIRDGRKSIFYR